MRLFVGVCIDVEGEDVVSFCICNGTWASSFVWFCDGVSLTVSAIGGATYSNWISVLYSLSNAEFNRLISLKNRFF